MAGLTQGARGLAKIGAVSVFALLLVAFAAAGSASAAKSVVNSVGGQNSGSKGGLFLEPRGVAINQTGEGGVPAGTFYVVDSGNSRVQRFSPTGDFVSTWGWGVKDGEAEFEICSVAAKCTFGLSGSGAGQLSSFGAQGVAIDPANGNVYVSDGGEGRINVFTAAGLFEGAFGWGVRDGSPELQFCTTLSGCREASESGGQGGQFNRGIGGLAVGSGGSLYVADSGNRRVDVFQPQLSGQLVTGIEFTRAFGFEVIIGGPSEYQVCTVASECQEAQSSLAGLEPGEFGFNSPSTVAVDSEGNIFALDQGNERIQEFDSTPAPVESAFGAAELTAALGSSEFGALAIDPSFTPNHLLVLGNRSSTGRKIAVVELDHSGNNALGPGELDGADLTANEATGLAVAPATLGGNVYVSSGFTGRRVFILNEPPTIEPVTSFTSSTAVFKGHVVSNEIDTEYHFEYSTDGVNWTSVPAVDASAGAQPGAIEVEQEATNLTGSQTYRVRLVQNRPSGGGKATSAETTFETTSAAPTITGTAVSHVTSSGATFNAILNPQNQATSYHFEFGFADCASSTCTSLPAVEASAGGARSVSQSTAGLQPNTLYHFRLVASNASGPAVGPDVTFLTAAVGTNLPDNRRYELVSPPDTGDIVPSAQGVGGDEGYGCFNTPLITPNANEAAFLGLAGSIPGTNGNGLYDVFKAVRGASGWSSKLISPSGTESTTPAAAGCFSEDLAYSTFQTGNPFADKGSLVLNGQQTGYIIPPSGPIELAGRGPGPVTEDPEANVRWITPDASHVIFTSSAQLTSSAPESVGPGFGIPEQYRPVGGVYDRSFGGPTNLLSSLPEGVAPSPEMTTYYQGASADGSAIVFQVEEKFFGETTMYEHFAGETVPIVTVPALGGVTFAGISDDGRRVFYLKTDEPSEPATSYLGQLFAFEPESETTVPITPGGTAFFFNVSQDGSHVYFGSREQLDGSKGTAGEPNLYTWSGSSPHYIATAAAADVEGGVVPPSLINWTRTAVSAIKGTEAGFANASSRTTADGNFMVFESRAPILEGFNNQGHSEIYLYDATAESLTCVSCNTTDTPATQDALLHPYQQAGSRVSALVKIANVTEDGKRVFFQTKEALVPEDVNGAFDVYEWEGGHISLISSGASSRSYLYSISPSGDDVFFTTKDLLLPADQSAVDSIYDARVGGGFPEPEVKAPCQGTACQGSAIPTPTFTAPGSSSVNGPGNPKHKKKPPKKKPPKKKHHKKKHQKRHPNKGRAQHRANASAGGSK